MSSGADLPHELLFQPGEVEVLAPAALGRRFGEIVIFPSAAPADPSERDRSLPRRHPGHTADSGDGVIHRSSSVLPGPVSKPSTALLSVAGSQVILAMPPIFTMARLTPGLQKSQ